MENETIQTNIERKRTLIDGEVQLLPDRMPLWAWLEISPSESCNRKCPFCPKADRERYPNQPLFMPPVLYRKLADELGALEYRGIVILAGYGEPMLSPHLYDMVAAFSAVAQVELVTDGDLLNDRTAARLLRAGVGMVLVSLYDGPHQVEMFRGLFDRAGYRPDQYALRDRWYGWEKDWGVKLTNRAGAVTVGDQPPVAADHLCYYPHYSMMIDWNGDALVCCQDWNRRIKVGNVASQTLLEVWSSRTLHRYRQRLATGQRNLAPCCNCNADGTLHGAGHREAWERFWARGAA